MKKNTFKVEYDTEPIFVVDNIKSILNESFGLDIISLSDDDDETQKFEIVKSENQKINT
ncbi:MAG: hypothetical protein RIR48_1248 [Bacteroidota bacterium]